MLTAEQIRNVKFRKSNIGGYKSEDVDMFIDEIEESFRKFEEEKEDLQDKLKILADKVCEYRDTEESIKTTLLNAQKSADALLREAKAEADRIVKQANYKYEEIIDKAEKDIANQKIQLANVKQNVRDFRNNILNMYKEHIKQVNLLTADDRMPADLWDKLSQKEKETKTSSEKISKDDKKVQLNDEAKIEEDNRYKDLKFGENYKIIEDQQESPIGLFDRV